MTSSLLRRSLLTYQIYASNTSIGKTLSSTILLKALSLTLPSHQPTYYLKPVSTGPPTEADTSHVSLFSPTTRSTCLFQFRDPVSPHLAARGAVISDLEIRDKVEKYLEACAEGTGTGTAAVLVETAGGVLSPTPEGTAQADLYRPLRLPVCLVTDHKLGGISASISAFESLHIRGYDLDAVLHFKDDVYRNHEYLGEYFRERGILSLVLPMPPERSEKEEEDREVMGEYYEDVSGRDEVLELVAKLVERHEKRIEGIENMSEKANKTIWYPFTQHKDVSPKTIMAIDSASGDFFQSYSTTNSSTQAREKQDEILHPTFDGSASWWTQGLGHGSPSLSLAASYAAGRYGHVMFAGTIHTPALELATTLLSTLQNPRLSRCFFSDNGSTGMEVAIKMALTATCSRYGWEQDKGVGVLGLKGSYHGDTIGAMDASEPSTYNEKVHWYQGRGYWFEFPEIIHKDGKWGTSEMVSEHGKIDAEGFASMDAIFDIQARKESKGAKLIKSFIEDTLKMLKEEGVRLGALVMEPVVLGAGGMKFVDPLFQHLLLEVVRESDAFPRDVESKGADDKAWSGLPVIFDEVFTGLYRLGRFTPSSFLQVCPDISVHAKLLTGGLVPLCTTLASESIYDAFLGDEKRDALLHGHSYTAHPVGCHVANTSLKTLMSLDQSGKWDSYKADWQADAAQSPGGGLWSSWSKNFVHQISFSKEVENVVALGSVLAINLRDKQAGYSSTAAIGLQKKLLEGSGDFKIHVRVLGNVLYVMASQVSRPETLRSIEGLLTRELL